MTTIPIVSYKHPSDVPSEEVLQRLSIFGRGHDVHDTHSKRKQNSERRSQEAQQQVGKEVQKKENRNVIRDLCPGDSGESGGGGGGRGCTPRDPSEQVGHAREHADTWTGNEASAHDASSVSTGACDGDGGGDVDGGSCDGGLL